MKPNELTQEETDEKVSTILANGKKLIEEAKALLSTQGEIIEFDEWLTIKRYAERFGVENTQTIKNWINRGVIPSENVREIEELNGLRLIKAVPYR